MALIGDAERTAHEAAAAVTARNIGGTPLFAFPVLTLRRQRHAIRILPHRRHLPAVTQRDIRTRRYLREQHLFHIHLVGAMDRLRYLIVHRSRRHLRHLLAFGRHAQPRQFMTLKAGHIDAVGRMIRRQAERAHARREAEPPVVLHGARIVCRAFRMDAHRRLGVEHHRAHAMPVEKQRQHQSDRPATNNRDGNLLDARFAHLDSLLVGRSSQSRRNAGCLLPVLVASCRKRRTRFVRRNSHPTITRMSDI